MTVIILTVYITSPGEPVSTTAFYSLLTMNPLVDMFVACIRAYKYAVIPPMRIKIRKEGSNIERNREDRREGARTITQLNILTLGNKTNSPPISLIHY